MDTGKLWGQCAQYFEDDENDCKMTLVSHFDYQNTIKDGFQ